jgi:hypothetical protein
MMYKAEFTGGNGSFTRMAALVWRGSTVMGTPAAIKMVATDVGNVDGTVQIYDVTNSTVICSVQVTANTPTLLSFGTLSNIPTGEAVWEIQVSSSGGVVSIDSLSIQY